MMRTCVALAGARDAIDVNTLDESQVVGITGERVAPNLYIALGIRGDTMHTWGMQGARYVVAVHPDPDAPILKQADAAIVGALARAGRAVLGREPALAGFPAACDMVHFRAAGIPTAVLGPGDLARAHTADEWVEVREVADAARIYALAALSLLAHAA